MSRDLEMSHGSIEEDEEAKGGALAAMGDLVLRGLRAGALASLVRCLRLELDATRVFQHLLRRLRASK